MSAREQAVEVLAKNHWALDFGTDLDGPYEPYIHRAKGDLSALNAAGLIVVRAEDVMATVVGGLVPASMRFTEPRRITRNEAMNNLRSDLADQSGGDHET